MVNFPKELKSYCRHEQCKNHQDWRVSQYKVHNYYDFFLGFTTITLSASHLDLFSLIIFLAVEVVTRA
jgi:hypothetical protein